MGDLLRFDVVSLAAGVDGPIDLREPKPLGAAGSFASVWRAGKRGEYAIKSFHEAGEDVVRIEYDFLVSLNKVGCPCVPRAICLGKFVDGEGDSHHAFVEQYIDGKSLAQVLNRGSLTKDARVNTVSTNQAITVAIEVAKALSAISRSGLAHRDLSPRNVMLTNACIADGLRGGAGVYLVDFGSSTHVDRLSVTPESSPRLGTIPYAAPEVFGGDFYSLRNSEKCDTWSLGALICTMVAGEYWPLEIADLRDRPLRPEDLSKIAEAKRTPIDLLSRLRAAGITPGAAERRLADLVVACTNYDPELRPDLDIVIRRLELLVSVASIPSAVTPVVEIERSEQLGQGGANGFVAGMVPGENSAEGEDASSSFGLMEEYDVLTSEFAKTVVIDCNDTVQERHDKVAHSSDEEHARMDKRMGAESTGSEDPFTIQDGVLLQCRSSSKRVVVPDVVGQLVKAHFAYALTRKRSYCL